MRPRDDSVLLLDMLEFACRARDAAASRSRADLEGDPVLAAALERFIELIGEAASRLSKETREAYRDIPWREIVALRNRLVHGYFAVDHDILWTIVTDDIPGLIAALEEPTEDA